METFEMYVTLMLSTRHRLVCFFYVTHFYQSSFVTCSMQRWAKGQVNSTLIGDELCGDDDGVGDPKKG